MATSVVYFSILFLCFPFVVHTASQIINSSEDFEGRIVKGEFAKISHYPHAVYLEVSRSDANTFLCGSSVVNQNFLVTAAHCFTYEDRGEGDKILAFAGHENIEKATIVRKSRRPILHKQYDEDDIVNDIALVYIAADLPLGGYVKRIIIKRTFPENFLGTIAGWGVINDITGQGTILLKSVQQTLKNRKICSPVLSGPGTLCAGSLRHSDPRPAEGDSGSGLITSNYELLGLLSYKQSTYPALPVYTNVTYYYNWIIYNTRSAYCSI